MTRMRRRGMHSESHFLIVGHGAREHAMARRLKREYNRVSVFSVHENAGLRRVCGDRNVVIADSYDVDGILAAARGTGAGVVVPGHEVPLFNGLSDRARREGMRVFGPSQEICRLEKDKFFAHQIAERVDPERVIKTRTFQTAAAAEQELGARDFPAVLKCWDGDKQSYRTFIMEARPTLGTEQEAEIRTALRDSERHAGSNPQPILLQEFVKGQDFSIYVVTDGARKSFSPAMQDYPFLEENNAGPKTGGMGCVTGNAAGLPFLDRRDIAAAEEFTAKYLARVQEEIGPMKGMYSFQFIKTESGIKFNEIDVRPGDPEMVNYLSLLATRYDAMIAGVCSGNMKDAGFEPKAAVSAYLVTPGYPVRKDAVTFRMDTEELARGGVGVAFGQVARDPVSGQWMARGSRAALISAVGGTITQSRTKVLRALEQTAAANHNALKFRRDIGVY